jgi:hypothetical protein
MGEVVARLNWTGTDMSSGASEGGLALVSLEDVVIVTRETTKGELMLVRRMIELNKPSPPAEDIERIRGEIHRYPSSDEVGEIWFLKTIQVSPQYHISYAEHPAADPLVGFGFSSGLGEVPQEVGCGLTFSWDWFNVTGPGAAEKLQGSGELSFEQRRTEFGLEITRMTFETNVLFRIAKRGGADPTKPDWQILVEQGSEIHWSSLVDGILVPYGAVQ